LEPDDTPAPFLAQVAESKPNSLRPVYQPEAGARGCPGPRRPWWTGTSRVVGSLCTWSRRWQHYHDYSSQNDCERSVPSPSCRWARLTSHDS